MTTTTRDRSDDEVRERARQIDAGRRAGLTDEQLVALVTARVFWHGHGQLRRVMLTPELQDAVATEAAMVWDAVFTTAVRRELKKLSGPGPSVP